MVFIASLVIIITKRLDIIILFWDNPILEYPNLGYSKFLYKKSIFFNLEFRMPKKSAVYGEYLISQDENGSISVLRKYDNVKASLRAIADEVGFAYDDAWTTRQFGTKLVKEYGDNGVAQFGEYGVQVLQSGSIESFKLYDNTKGALREIAEAVGFDYDDNWNTRQFGSKLIGYLS